MGRGNPPLNHPMSSPDVIRLGPAAGATAIATQRLFVEYGLTLIWLSEGVAIPGSYWGESEAGLIRSTLYVRADTPLHSALHEGCHFVCADDARRADLETDAGGGDLEECAVCYLSVVLADRIADFGAARMLADMDAWGYSFRWGGAERWFCTDAEDAHGWLVARGLLATCSMQA